MYSPTVTIELLSTYEENMPSSTEVTPHMIARAVEVEGLILGLKDTVQDSAIEMAYLLKEANDKQYYRMLGVNTFSDWINKVGLDMSERAAAYLLNIARKAELLGIDKAELKKSKISKLKEIFSLDAGTNGTEIKALLAGSQEESLDVVKEKVQQVKAKDGHEPNAYMTFKMPVTVKEEIVLQAFELVRRLYGSVIDENTGEVIDISDSKCLELVCAEFLNTGNQYAAEQQPGVIDVSYEEVIST